MQVSKKQRVRGPLATEIDQFLLLDCTDLVLRYQASDPDDRDWYREPAKRFVECKTAQKVHGMLDWFSTPDHVGPLLTDLPIVDDAALLRPQDLSAIPPDIDRSILCYLCNSLGTTSTAILACATSNWLQYEVPRKPQQRTVQLVVEADQSLVCALLDAGRWPLVKCILAVWWNGILHSSLYDVNPNLRILAVRRVGHLVMEWLVLRGRELVRYPIHWDEFLEPHRWSAMFVLNKAKDQGELPPDIDVHTIRASVQWHNRAGYFVWSDKSKLYKFE